MRILGLLLAGLLAASLPGCSRALEPWPGRDLVLEADSAADRAMADARRDRPRAEAPLDLAPDASVALHSGLVSYWSCEESSGPIKDRSGKGMDLIAVSANVTFEAPGKYTKGLSIVTGGDGFAAYRLVPHDYDTSGWPSLTALAWVKGTALGGAVINIRDVQAGLYVGNSSIVTYGMATTGDCAGFSASATLGDGQWHQVGLLRRADQLLLVVDGKVVGSGSCTGALVRDTYHVVFVGSTWGTSGNVFNGQLDEVGVWSRDLSDSELAAHAKGVFPFP